MFLFLLVVHIIVVNIFFATIIIELISFLIAVCLYRFVFKEQDNQLQATKTALETANANIEALTNFIKSKFPGEFK